jgi:uncharacterized membrane protein YebE (DUF533 family)
MTPDRILGAVLRGVLGARKKPSGRTLRYLTGGRGSFVNTSTLLTVAGLGYAAYEIMRSKNAQAAPAGVPPAVPVSTSSGGPLPPLPGAPVAGRAAGPALPDDALRAVRLAISAARVDGDLTPAERDVILAEAREAGAEGAVDGELQRPRPLTEIVAGISDRRRKEDLYVLAFSIVRADGDVSATERAYLAQLAQHLGLDDPATARLEADATAALPAQA